MKIYEANIIYNTIGHISAEACNSPEAVIQYMESAFEKFPEQEQFDEWDMKRVWLRVGRLVGKLHRGTVWSHYSWESGRGKNRKMIRKVMA